MAPLGVAAGLLVRGSVFASAVTGVRVVADEAGGSSSALVATCVTAGGGVLIAVIGLVATLIGRRRPASDLDERRRLEDQALEQVVAEQAAEIVQLRATVSALQARGKRGTR